jgi:molybdopterin-guanine dinucleotide biosynthesis protein A
MSVQSAASISCIILAGGRSRRLGMDKAFLPILGQPLIALTTQRLATLSDDLIVVTNEPGAYSALRLPARLVGDERPGQGSLMGIYSGLKEARHSHALVVACDMPFLSLPLLRHLTTLTAGYDVVIPRLGSMLEPLHAIYGRRCLQPMAQLLSAGEHQIIAFFSQVRVRVVDEREIEAFDADHRSFLNVNTAEDWARAQTMLADAASHKEPSVTIATAPDEFSQA